MIPYTIVFEKALEKNPGLTNAAALEEYKKLNKAIARHTDCLAKKVMAVIAYRVALELYQIYTIRMN